MRIAPGRVVLGLGLAVATLAGGACSKQRRRGPGAGASRDGGLALPVVVDAAVGHFTASGWEGLAWSASPDDARTLLTDHFNHFQPVFFGIAEIPIRQV